MRQSWVFPGTLILVVFALCTAGTLATMAQETTGLEFVDDGKISITYPNDKTTGKTTVTVKNTTNQPLQAQFCVVSNESSSRCDGSKITISLVDSDGVIAANTAQSVSLELTWTNANDFEETSGYLVLTIG